MRGRRANADTTELAFAWEGELCVVKFIIRASFRAKTGIVEENALVKGNAVTTVGASAWEGEAAVVKCIISAIFNMVLKMPHTRERE